MRSSIGGFTDTEIRSPFERYFRDGDIYDCVGLDGIMQQATGCAPALGPGLDAEQVQAARAELNRQLDRSHFDDESAAAWQSQQLVVPVRLSYLGDRITTVT